MWIIFPINSGRKQPKRHHQLFASVLVPLHESISHDESENRSCQSI
jgi:hypothetical protein